MKTRNKIVSLICVVAMILSSCAMIISAVDTPVEGTESKWADASSTDYAYSLAFVGDTQHITVGDYYTGSEKLKTQFKYIADTAEDRKLEHVFLLGDLTDLSYHNDANLAATSTGASGTGEWEIVKTAVDQLNGVVPYSVNRGNHDDYLIDHYFNTDTYKAQFTNGGFYTDTDATYVGTITSDDTTLLRPQQSGNAGHKVYWNTKDGNYGSTKGSIVNSYKKVEIGGTKYLFMTIDYNPSEGVIDWVNETLAANPDCKAIVTTHHFIEPTGNVATSIKGATRFRFETGTPEYLWENALSKHENVFMIVSGHAGNIDLTYSYQRGEKGNKVLQVMTNPQTYDTKETDANGTYTEGTQDTGMVLYMNFSADGKTVNFEYYSTLLGKVLKNNNYTVNLGTEASVGGDVNLSNFEAYGQKNAYVTVNSTTAPTLNGAIGNDEYSVTKVTSKGDTTLLNFESDLKEWFAKDDEYIYYAFQTVRMDGFSGSNWQLNLKPGGWFTKDVLKKEALTRTAIEFSWKLDATTGSYYIYKGSPKNQNLGTTTLSYPRWDEDIFIFGTRDNETGVCTVEFKISLDYFAMNDPDFTDLDSLGYMLYLHKNSAGSVWYQWEKTYIPSEVTSEIGTTPAFLPQYMVFNRDYAEIETSEKAGVRLNNTPGQSGLRFKTAIKTETLNDFVEKYGRANVGVGTLIAPADLWTTQELRHENGTDNKDYIDVEATVGSSLETSGDYSIYAGSIINIKEKNYERDFIAVGYIKVMIDGEATYIYSEVTAKRSISDVADAAYHDVEDSQIGKYQHKIENESDMYYGKWSKYTKEQRDILYSYIANKDDSKKDPFGFDKFDPI